MKYKCGVCDERVEGDLLVYIKHTEKHIFEEIKRRYPEWIEQDGICPKCVDYYKRQIKGENPS